MPLGFVYLLKSGRFYKIGRTNADGRPHRELAIQLPERARQVHVIKADDPVGIERYWHQRFADKRVRPDAEWFDLSSDDLAAFKRRVRGQRRDSGPPKIPPRIAGSRQLKAELDYCAPLGIPRSVFLSRVVVPGEATWLDKYRLYVLAWQAEKAETCSGCGQPVAESTAPRSDDAYSVHITECFACSTVQRRTEGMTGGLLVRVERTG